MAPGDEGGRAAVEAVARERAVAAFQPQAELALDVLDLGLPHPAKILELQQAKRRPGRPPGAPNKRAEDVARAIIEKLGDPLVMLASIALTPTDELVAAGLTVEKALEEKRLAAIGVLPYVHQRKPVALEVGGALPVLVLADPRGYVAPTVAGGKIEEIQIVDEGADGPV